MRLPAITLWQPYASLIFTGDKAHETRGRTFPPKYWRKRVAIHAAARPLSQCGVSPALDALCRAVFGENYADELPRGVLLGTVILRDSAPTEVRRDDISDEDYAAGDWSDGRHCWLLDAPELLNVPRPMPGKQGWFNVEL